MAKREEITLSELQERIGKSIENSLPGKYWVRAETGEVKVHSGGHCYMELIDRKTEGGILAAKVQAVIWSSTFRMLRPYFETTTGRALESGIKILVCVQVQYSSLYGLSLVISDIDPSFTIGEQELLRQKTIQKLKDEGMFEVNSSLEIPILPRNIAVISSENAAGYRDFMQHTSLNEYGFKFNITLFSAPMQGDTAPAGIIAALESIAAESEMFDIVLITRGGGSAQDLICFDDYNLAVNIAQFPLPVITGIGHDHDYHIADMVSHTNVKTPTAAADFLLDLFIQEEQHLNFLSNRVAVSLRTKFANEEAAIERRVRRVKEAVARLTRDQEHKLELLEKRAMLALPLNILERGYSIALKNGKKITNSSQVNQGDNITLVVAHGIIDCTVNSKRDE
ncbi:MAG: exodeoxyribonuclease VII large subunit [Bacteroidetes bacterium RIFOXYB2_FULL_39_7]|nr:MAG: exodeoxyribonuclease VII large subunit [Bacteroidetes bacterium RIFOXYB2_FULL_39_7]